MTTTLIRPPSPTRRSASVRRARLQAVRQVPLDALPLKLRQQRVEVLVSAFQAGRSISADALTLLLAVKEMRPEPNGVWTVHTIVDLLDNDIDGVCARLELAPPPRIHQTIRVLIDHLARSGQLRRGSDDLREFRAAIAAHAARLTKPTAPKPPVDQRAAPNRHPSRQLKPQSRRNPTPARSPSRPAIVVAGRRCRRARPQAEPAPGRR